MLERGRAAGLALAVTDVLPWNNGDERAADGIRRLNALIAEVAADAGATLLPFHDALADPTDPTRMRDGLTDDGDHPSVEGHRLLGERACPGLHSGARRRALGRRRRARRRRGAGARPAGG